MRRAERMTSPKAISVLFGLVALFEMLFLLVLGPQFSEITNDTALLDMKVGYSYGEVCRMLANYTPAGRAFYHYIQLADFFFPVVYTLFFIATIVSLLICLEF